MSIADALALLTPGAVFVNKKGRTAKLLLVTNTSLAASVQVSHPPQVVYASDDGEFFNRDLDDFLDKYQFYNVDPELESRLENLLVFSEDDPAHEALAATEDEPLTASQIGLTTTKTGRVSGAVENQSNIPQATKIVAEALNVGNEEDDLLLPPQAEEELKIATPAFLREATAAVKVRFRTVSDSLSVGEAPQQLSKALVAYGQEPDIANSLIVHRLTFALSAELTIQDLQELFRPRKNEDDPRHTMDVFEVHTTFGSETTMWTAYLGVFPEYTKSGLYATVLLGTDEFIAEEEPQDAITEAPSIPSQAEALDVSHEALLTANPSQVYGHTEVTPDSLLSNSVPEVEADAAPIAQPTAEEVAAVADVSYTSLVVNPPLDQLFAQSNQDDVPGSL